jgi:hypothetical protein
VLPTGLLCSNKDCFFRAGSIVDYMAVRTGSMRAAVELLVSQFKEQIVQLSQYQSSEIVPAITASAVAKRTLFEFFLRLRLDASDNISHAQAKGFLAAQSIDYEHVKASVYPATAEDMLTLQRLAGNLGIDIVVPSGPVILFPYFGNHHSVAQVIAVQGTRSHYIKLLPYRFSLFALNEGRPDSSCQLSYEFYEAATLNSRYHSFDPAKICYGLWHNPFTRKMGVVPKQPIYLYNSDHDAKSINVVTAFSRSCSGLLVSPDRGTPLPWNAFLVTEVIRRLRKAGSLTSEIRLFLDTARPALNEQTQIFSELKKFNLYTLAGEIADYMRAGPVFQADNVSLFETPEGYYITRKEGDYKTQVANFTVQLETNLTFPDSDELFHTGYLTFQGCRYPLMLENRSLDRAQDFESSARSALAHQDVELMPAVSDRAGVKHAQAYLRAMTATLPRVDGLMRLGWSGRRDSFVTPTCRIRETALETHHVFHPSVDVLKSYRTTGLEDLGYQGRLSPGLSALVAQATALVARSFLNLPVKPIQIRNSPSARHILLEVFRGLGQKEIIRLNFNIRANNTELRGTDGYPFVAYGYTTGQIERSTLPAFILGEEGTTLEGEVSTEELNYAAIMLCRAVCATAAFMIKTQGKDYRRQQAVSNETELAREGAWLIQEVCGMEWTQSPARYQMIEQMLRTTPLEKVEEVFSHYLAGQRLYIDLRLLDTSVDPVTLELELSHMTTSFAKTRNYFSVDALSGMLILNNFYEDKAFPNPITGPPLDPSSPSKSIPGSVGGNG